MRHGRDRRSHDRRLGICFAIGDGLASIAVGVATAWLVRKLVAPGSDVALAMLLGMGAGMLVHLALGLLLSPLLGAIEAMTASGLTGMYGGMFFAMRDAMRGRAAGTAALARHVAERHDALWTALWTGALFGLLVWVALVIYGRVVQGVVFDARPSGRGEEDAR